MKITSIIRKTLLIKILWVVAYTSIALSFVFFANDNTFPEQIQNPSFFTDIIFSMTLTFGTGFYLKKLNAHLDKEYSWYKMFRRRIILQIVFGILLPLFISMSLEIIYLRLIGISFSESSIINLEFPLAFIFLLLLNLVSLTGYLFKNKQQETIIINKPVLVSAPKSLEYINVQKGFVEERIELNNCALIMSANKLLWLHTYDREKYRLLGTLEEWEEKLKFSNFYRINRQYLSSFNAIQSVEQTETRKLKVHFVIPTDEVYISKPNVANFKQWWKQ